MRVPGIHGKSKNTYPRSIGTSGSSATGFRATRRRAASTSPATTASVLPYQRTGLPMATITCRSPVGVANREERRMVRSISGQLHQGDPQGFGIAAVTFSKAWMCQFHVHCQASQGFVVTEISAPRYTMKMYKIPETHRL